LSGPLGAVIAGGRSVRYGSPKALAHVGGKRIIDRVVEALRGVVEPVVLIANDADLASAVTLPTRPDVLAGLGALGGIHSALLWARESGRPGVVAVACDMPFLSPALLGRILERAADEDAPDVVAPASEGPRGLEPLCAYYAITCIDAIERAVANDDRRMIGFHGDVRVAVLPLDEVATFGRAELLFLNVNTPEERATADRLATGESA
jgi:molybdopterin-guanine dinucleotide biosynthesis protein A